MEKEIIVLIIIMVLALITAITTLISAKNRDEESIYMHIKTGNKYRIFQECKMKFNGKWMDSVVYVSEKNNEMFVRVKNDFLNNFIKLSEWKEN